MVKVVVSWLFAILSMGSQLPVSAQENSIGIYVTTKLKQNCQKSLLSLNKKETICVTDNPVLSAGCFSKVTKLKENSLLDIYYFHLVFSESGYQKFKLLYTELPNAEFVLVVDNKVIGFIKNPDEIKNKSLQIDGDARSPELKWVHEKLKAVILAQPEN
jgi:hypothetical protein